jgi:cell division protein FtsA
LDLGTTKVCTLIAEVVDRRAPDIIGVGVAASHGMRRGVVVDVERTVEAIKESVEAAQRIAGAEVAAVVVGVTGQHITSLNSRGVVAITHPERLVGRSDVERVLENARFVVRPPEREILHAIPRGFTLDGFSGIRNPVGMRGTRLEVDSHIVMGENALLRNVAICVEQAGLEIDDMVLEPIATAEAVLLSAEKELGVALIDIGGGTSDIAVFRDGEICFSGVVPIGGEYVTRDIAAGLRTHLEEAERVKRLFGEARARDVPSGEAFLLAPMTEPVGENGVPTSRVLLAQIIEARVCELLEMAGKMLLRAGFDTSLPGGLVLSGGGSQLAGIRALAEETTGLPTRVGAPLGIGGLTESVAEPTFSTAVGLVRWGARGVLVAPRRPTQGLLGAVSGWMRRAFRE